MSAPLRSFPVFSHPAPHHPGFAFRSARFFAHKGVVSFSRIAALCLSLVVSTLPSLAAGKSRATPRPRAESPGVARPFAVPDDDDPNVFPAISAEAVLLCDAATGRVLYEKNADAVRPVASTQKLLTALVIAEAGDLNGKVKVAAGDSDCEPTKLGLKTGEVYRRYELLRVLLIKSMNDVARCLARDNAGSQSDFAAKMNAKARELGMRNSNFVNPNGLTERGQYSTARDMGRLALHAYRNRVIRGIVSTRVLPWTTPSGKTMTFENTNKLLKYFGACNGMKTGYTEASGNCLISSASEGGKHTICVVLGEKRRSEIFNDSYKLMHWGLHQLRTQPAEPR